MPAFSPGVSRKLLVSFLLGLAGTASAHQQWLLPNAFLLSGESAWVSFDHTFGDKRFQSGSGPGGYYTSWVVGPDGMRQSVPFLFVGKTRTTGEVELDEPGTYRLESIESMSWSKLSINGEDRWHPGTRDDFPDHEVTASRFYFQKALSYVTLESAGRDVLKPTGEPLEIVFGDHPNEWREGRELKIRVLAHGKPLPAHDVKIFTEHTVGHDEEAVCTTDRAGRCTLKSLAPGKVLLVSRVEGESPAPAGTDGFTHTVNVLLELLPASAPMSQ